MSTTVKRKGTGMPKLNSIVPARIDWTCDTCEHTGSDSVSMLHHASKHGHKAFTRRD